MNIKYFYKKTPCLLFLLALMMTTACTDDRVVDDSIYEDGPKIPIVLSLKGLFGEGTPTYALSDSIDQAGTGAENTITDVTVFIFNATNACEKILKAPNPFVNPMDTVLVTAGNKKIIAVVNGHNRFNPPSPGTSATFYSPGDEGSVSYNGLRTMLTNPAITALPVGPFLMTGETSENLQPDFPSTAPNEVTITVKRAVAKVKVYVKKANDVTQNLYMQKVTLSHGADMVSIIQNDPATASSISYNISSTARTTFTSSTIPDVASGTYCEPIDSLFYTFESLANRDKSKAAYLDLEVGVNSTTNIRTARVYLAANDVSPGDTIYDIHRNYWYCVYINIVDPGLDSVYVTVVASPWNVADTIHVDAGVGGYDVETATPFKLVKYYDAADFGKDNKIVAINKHSKGASWIDLKVSEGASWELNWTGGANTGAIMSADTFKTYVTYPTSLPPGTGKYSTTGTGTTDFQRIYIYRPFVENNEPKDGPSVTLKVGGQVVRTFKVEGRDSLIYPTNSYVLRPDVYTGGTSGSDGYIMLKPVYD
ncbi:MAG: FimB/Mfa2 family fimbrial subunit, partial [Tannerella sp.]|nr:FimB/Mfa2 family fimbrial subunit [Tannerella sp.]